LRLLHQQIARKEIGFLIAVIQLHRPLQVFHSGGCVSGFLQVVTVFELRAGRSRKARRRFGCQQRRRGLIAGILIGLQREK